MTGQRAEAWPVLDRLREALENLPAEDSPAAWLDRLIGLELDQLPLPGSGRTLARWQALAAVATRDLSLAKLYEGHTDALAILRELHGPHEPADGAWGVWAAEPPGQRALIESSDGREVVLGGAKAWCSGAAGARHALLTAWHVDGRGPQLVRVDLRQPGVQVSNAVWKAVGMAGSASLDVTFREARGQLVGEIGGYLQRPGFWQGGAGIAACWYGGTLALADALRAAMAKSPESARSPFRLAALGKVDVALSSTAALLREAADWIDTHPQDDASAAALRVRQSAEATARLVLDEVGRALGATPFCRDARFARSAADLPVFIRQSHGDRDFAALGERLISPECNPWDL